MKSILRLLSTLPTETPLARARRLGRAFGLKEAWRPGATIAKSRTATASGATARDANDATRASSPASFDESTYTAAGQSRRYKLYVPATLPPAPALILMLHGCTQDADDFAAGTRMNALADRDGFLVLYPIQSRAANPAVCWNWFRDQDQRRDAGEPAFLVALVREIAAEHHVDAERIFVAGLSAGAAMAAILGREYPDVFAAIGVHSGLAAGSAHNVPDAMRAMKSGWQAASAGRHAHRSPPPAIVFQGDRDTTVHPSNADHVVASLLPIDARPPRVLEVADSGGRSSTRSTYADAHGRTVVERWTIHGAGHAWSGGDRRGTYADPAGVDASAEMLRFFGEHARRGSAG